MIWEYFAGKIIRKAVELQKCQNVSDGRRAWSTLHIMNCLIFYCAYRKE